MSNKIHNLNYRLARYIPGFGHQHYSKFIVLTRSRTGSNLLVQTLDTHPQVAAYGEEFAKLEGKTIQQKWTDIFQPMPRGVKAVGFKIFYYHPLDHFEGAGDVWGKLVEDKSIRIIHLMRRNKLRTIVSREIAGKTDKWRKANMNNTATAEDKKIMLSLDDLRYQLNYTTKAEIESQQRFAAHSTLNMYYEELTTNINDQINKVFDFLELRHLPLRIPTKRQNPEKLSELLVNYAEIKKELAGTEWETCLED